MNKTYYGSLDSETRYLAHKLKDGLDLALGEKSIDIEKRGSSDPVVGVNPILLWSNKAVYRAIREMGPDEDTELPIVYSWFRYGPSTQLPIIQPKELNPRTLGEVQDLEQGPYPTKYHFYEFFADLIDSEAFFDQELTEYLYRLYEEAPKGFGGLYEKNFETQELLAEFHSIRSSSSISEDRIESWFSTFEPLSNSFERLVYRSDVIEEEAEKPSG